MADYDLTQTGQEVQDILDGAAMQTDLTAETERAELAEQTLQGGIDAEETRAKAAEKQNADDIDVIESKIPAGASDQNQLADKQYVNDAVATASATYRGAYNLVNDLSLTVGATHEQIATALAGAISTADNNDYCFVQIPTADAAPTQIASIERYKFNGTAWAYEYTLNNSGFTAAQWAALNSGITSGLVAKLLALPTNDALTLALAGKQDVLTFDSVPVDGSNNPVESGGVYSAIGDEETRAKAAEKANADDIDNIEALIPATASDENQLADKQYVNDGIATASATYRGSFNEVNDLSLTTDATHEQIATALAGAIGTADNNDYCFVQIPTSDAAPTQIASIERYKFNGTAWAYEYTLNNSGFTAAQWAALNSGITSGLVAKLSALPTNDALTLALAGKQDVLTFDNEPTSGSNNPVKSGGVYDAIDVEATTRAAAIAAIVALIPEAASALNQLADKSFVNSSISTATAVFKGTYNVVVDLELSYNATQEQIATMLASKIISADNNDYCFVQIPTSDAAPLQIARTDRYKFNGTAWAYEYTLNNSGFTAAQWAAINSGITSLLKDKLIDLPTATELTALLAAKQNQLTFDTTPTTGSTNPVTSGGIKSAIDAEKTRAEAAEGALDSEKADKATTLAGYGITDAYTKSETYTKTEVNGLVSTPHQNYVTVATYSGLPASGSTDTIYRVSSYDGANNQVDDTVYSEYAWDGTQYVFLRVNSQIEEVFDITVYNNNTKYADLSAALGVDGANIPATLRRGGMSVKFVQSSDNNYIQARCVAQSFTTDVTQWQIQGEEVTVAIGVNLLNPNDADVKIGYYITSNGDLTASENYNASGFISVTEGQAYTASKSNSFRFVNFYKSDKSHISGSQIENSTGFTVPENAAYIRVSIRNIYWDYAFVAKGNQRIDYIQYSPIAEYYAKPLDKSVTDEALNSERVNTLEEKDNGLVVTRSNNLFDAQTMIIEGQYVNNSGAIGEASGWARTDYIEITEGHKYIITAATIARSTGLGWYNASKQLVSGGALNIYNTVLTAPEGAKYLIFNVGYNNTLSTKIMMVEGEVAQPYESPYIIPMDSVRGLSSKIEETKEDLQSEIDALNDGILVYKRNSSAGTFIFQTDKGTISFINRSANHSQNIMLNFSGWSIAEQSRGNDDDVAPAHILNTTIGANHGLPCAKVYIPSHGFDNTIIGTEWAHTDGYKYYPALIIDSDNILFISENTGTMSSPTFFVMGTGILSYNGNTYTISTISTQQLYPSIADYGLSVKIDDKTNNSSGEYRCKKVQLVESYTIINPASVLVNLIARAGQSSEPSFDGDKVARVENIYQIDEELNVIVISDFIVLDTIAFQNLMFTQAISIAPSGVKYYIPNSLPWNGLDLRTPQAVSWSSSLPSAETDIEHTKVTANPINRVLQYSGNLGFALGYVPTIGVGEDLFSYTSNTFVVRNTSGKIYPNGVNSTVKGSTLSEGDMFSAVLYRCFFDASTTTNRQSEYHFELNGVEYVFIDYKGSMIDKVNMDKSSLNGKKVEVVENQNAELKTNVYNDGFYVEADYVTNETCYIVVKIS